MIAAILILAVPAAALGLVWWITDGLDPHWDEL